MCWEKLKEKTYMGTFINKKWYNETIKGIILEGCEKEGSK